MKICIYTYGFRAGCGGATAMYKLASLIRDRGVDCCVHQDRDRSDHDDHYRVPRVDESWIDPETWVIYPETVIGNPLRASRVIRWLLNGVGVIGGDKTTWGPADLAYAYQPKFRSSPGDPLLMVFETWPEINFPGNGPRSGTAYVIHKGHHKPLLPETSDAVLVSRVPSEAAEILRRSERFISYDTVTFMSLQAALCGCLSIVVPDDGMTAEKWREQISGTKYGIAYGFSDAEINHARETRHLVEPYLDALQAESQQQITGLLQRLQEAA